MPHLGLKRQLGKIWSAQPKGRKVALLYHSIGKTPWALSESMFKHQIDWLYNHSRILSLTELIKAKPSDELQVAITFDDGYDTLYNHAAPILAEKKLGAMVYLNTGWIAEHSKDRKSSDATLGHYPEEFFLTWKEVNKLHHAGWEIGSHGVNHYNVAQLDPEVLKVELSHSKQHIEKFLKISCLHFAYPWGRYSKSVKQVVNLIGYQYAAAAFHAPLTKHADLLSFPRMNIATEYSLQDFKNIMLGKWDYLGLVHRIRGL